MSAQGRRGTPGRDRAVTPVSTAAHQRPCASCGWSGTRASTGVAPPRSRAPPGLPRLSPDSRDRDCSRGKTGTAPGGKRLCWTRGESPGPPGVGRSPGPGGHQPRPQLRALTALVSFILFLGAEFLLYLVLPSLRGVSWCCWSSPAPRDVGVNYSPS